MNKLLLCLILSLLFLNPVYSQWSQTKGPGISQVNILYKYNGELFAGTQVDGVYRSTDYGSSWLPANNGLENIFVNTFTSNSDYLFAGVGSNTSSVEGIFRSSDHGQTWVHADNGLPVADLASLLAVDASIYAGTGSSGVWKSTDNGNTWLQSNTGMGNDYIISIIVCNGVLFAAGSDFLYSSANGGATWSIVSAASAYLLFSLKADGNYIYAGSFGGLIRSSDYGQTWSSMIHINFIPSLSRLQSFDSDSSTLYAGVSGYPSAGYGVIKSTDHGLTWQAANTGIEERSMNSVVSSLPDLLAGCQSGGVYSSTDQGNGWATDNSGLPRGGTVRSLLTYSNYIFAGTQLDGIYGSSDGGVNWESFDNDASGELKFSLVFALTQKDSTLYAGTSVNGVYKSTDSGYHWVQVNNGLPTSYLSTYNIVPAGNNLIVGTNTGLYYSTNDGTSWQVSNVNTGYVQSLAAGNGYQYAIVITGIFYSDGIYRSSDNGVSWTLIYQGGANPITLAARGSYVYLGDLENGIQHSSDYGNSWTGGSLPGIGVYAIYILGENVFVGTQPASGNVYISDFNATNWQAINDGLQPATAVNALTSDNSFLYIGTEDRAVWSRSLDQIVPVELVSFNAVPENGSVILNWATATETNNKGFEVQRKTLSNDLTSLDWKDISFVKGHGTITQPQQYTYTDNNVENGGYSYRLKQIDFDGTYKNSKEVDVNVNIPLQFSLSQNYPNPFNPTTTIDYSISKGGIAKLIVYNTLGQQITTLVNENMKAGNYHVSFDASGLASGIYYYKLESNDQVIVKKMVLLR